MITKYFPSNIFKLLSTICCGFIIIFAPTSTSALKTLNENTLNMYAQNNILFYNFCDGGGKKGSCGADLDCNDAMSCLEDFIDKYAELAMNIQREFGTPWESVFFHAIAESGVGTSTTYGWHTVAAENGNYNWVGHSYNSKGLYNVADSAVYEPYGKINQYSSIANMVAGHMIDFLRNGLYDGFQYTDPNNYSWKSFEEAAMPTFCNTCSFSKYWPNGHGDDIIRIAQEKGLKSSAELAKEENIPIGGNYPNVKKDVKDELGEPHSRDACADFANGANLSSSSNSSSSNNSSDSAYSSGITWTDGWITGGLDGYTKEAAEGSSYGLPEESVNGGHTQPYATDGKPNKILLHTTEGGAGNGTSGLALYGSITKGGVTGITPAHFTINPKDKKVFQHFSINKPSDAIIEDLDAGVQIEIIGFMDNLGFSDEDWNYLAKLLIGISSETGIPLTSSVDWSRTNRLSAEDFHNYSGVLGHMHAPSTQNHDDPGPIWEDLSAAIEREGGVKSDPCGGGSPNGDLSSYVLAYAWPETGHGDVNKEEYQQVASEHSRNGKYTGSNGFTHTDQVGVDCGGFVTTIITESKFDTEYNYEATGGNTSYQEKYTYSKWRQVSDTSQLQPGDVAFTGGSAPACDGCLGSATHTFLYVGEINGFPSKIASASWGKRSPCIGEESITGARWYHKE